jgi:hypothetical protein
MNTQKIQDIIKKIGSEKIIQPHVRFSSAIRVPGHSNVPIAQHVTRVLEVLSGPTQT